MESVQEAQELAKEVVNARLAACVQVLGPVLSTYRWKGDVEVAEEWVCSMKTTSERFSALESFIKSRHAYETAEIIASPIVAGNPEYLEWIEDEILGKPGPA